MRFSIAVLALAAGALAADVTETVTQYTTFCPEATTIAHGGHTYSISTPGHITMTNGPYTVTRPLITQTVTQCNSCSSTMVPSSTPIVPSAPASTPLIPSGAGATGSSVPSGAAAPAFNAGAVNAATGAGAGLAAVFGAVALLL
ncbi:hypothetical protein N7448_004033 [Penicillium atrosanguineum]|nr:hypothetical protein N7526_011195 [Penicillium atrosanguineum]KAJ5140625.1 hypothetical protein N7448_004033 [Penicillium atrosanguineum]